MAAGTHAHTAPSQPLPVHPAQAARHARLRILLKQRERARCDGNGGKRGETDANVAAAPVAADGPAEAARRSLVEELEAEEAEREARSAKAREKKKAKRQKQRRKKEAAARAAGHADTPDDAGTSAPPVPSTPPSPDRHSTSDESEGSVSRRFSPHRCRPLCVRRGVHLPNLRRLNRRWRDRPRAPPTVTRVTTSSPLTLRAPSPVQDSGAGTSDGQALWQRAPAAAPSAWRVTQPAPVPCLPVPSQPDVVHAVASGEECGADEIAARLSCLFGRPARPGLAAPAGPPRLPEVRAPGGAIGTRSPHQPTTVDGRDPSTGAKSLFGAFGSFFSDSNTGF